MCLPYCNVFFVREPGDVIPYCIISVLAANGGNLINVFYVRKYAKIRFTFDMDLKRHLMPLLILFGNPQLDRVD